MWYDYDLEVQVCTHHHVLAEVERKKIIESSSVIWETIQHSSNRVGVKEQNGSSQNGRKHSIVQHSRGVDTNKEEGYQSRNVHNDEGH